MTSRKDLFTKLSAFEGEVNLGDGSPLKIHGIGTILLHMSNDCGSFDLEFNDVLYVPELEDNLISQGTIEAKGMKIVCYQGLTSISDNDCVFLKAHRIGTLYYITTVGSTTLEDIKKNYEENGIIKASRVTADIWHQRLGHLNQEDLKKIESVEVSKLTECDTCHEGKARRTNFPIRNSKTDKVLERVHSDIVGPITPTSRGGANYFITFIDNYSRYAEVCLLGKKSGALEAFKKYQKRVECLQEGRIKEFQTDNGGEYIGNLFLDHLEDKGILHRLSCRYTPQQNGLAERYNLTVLNVARGLILKSGVPKYFWGEAVRTASYLRNLSPSSAIEYKIPAELWRGREVKKEEYKQLRVFGCQVWAWDPVKKGKFSPRAKKCVMLGYEEGSRGYRVWNLEEKKIIVCIDTVFNEDVFPFKIKATQEPVESQVRLPVISIFKERNVTAIVLIPSPLLLDRCTCWN
ncbi:hypothetical protein FOCC_FOCC015166 [Frankliniella occidentalis]|nr:hypothetical protein FOCC_FOCC015166 [Frankliniella occidentalis]